MASSDTNISTNESERLPKQATDGWGVLKVARRIAGFHKERKGVAAVEFALIAPFMVALWLGSIELSQAVSIDRKVSLAASALADLVTQQVNVTPDEMEDIMDATVAIMMPYSTDTLSISIAGVDIDDDGVATVTWSDSRNAAAAAVGGGYDIPAVLVEPDSFLVVAELSYLHTPVTSQALTGPITLTDEFFLRPRRSDRITNIP